jgi:hypothetical protein
MPCLSPLKQWRGSPWYQVSSSRPGRRLGQAADSARRSSKIRIYAYTRGKEDRVVRREANIRLHSCKGQIAMNLSRDCYIREVYTRGECSLAGAKNY